MQERHWPSLNRILEVVRVKTPIPFSTGRMEIVGLAAGAHAAGEALGTQWRVNVPKDAILAHATYYDLSDLNVQTNLVIANSPFGTQIADNAAFNVAIVDQLKIEYEIEFVVFNNHITSRSSYVDHIDRIVRFPSGVCYLQAWSPAAQTPVAAKIPQVQLDFFPY